MSARMLRARHDPEATTARRQRRAAASTPHRPLLHRRCSTGRCGTRADRRRRGASSCSRPIPLYRIVRQEYIPSDVDEAEFEVNVIGAGRHELSRDGRSDDGRRAGDPQRARRAPGAVDDRRHLPRRRESGDLLRADRAARRACVLVTRLAERHRHAAIRSTRSGTTTRSADVMQAVRGRLRRYSGSAHARFATSSRSTSAAANWDIDFVLPRSRSQAARPATPSSCAQRAEQLGLVDADTTLKLNKPELQVRDRSRARRGSRRRHRRTSPQRCA